jgi:hypothetical protein
VAALLATRRQESLPLRSLQLLQLVPLLGDSYLGLPAEPVQRGQGVPRPSHLLQGNSEGTMNSDPKPNHIICPNDFDVAFADSLPLALNEQPGQGAWPWLNLWTAQNPGRHPSKQESASLAVLTGAREDQITAWMEQYIGPACPTPSDNGEAKKTLATHRPKCIDSRWRYRYRGPQEDATKIFECTCRCGQSFPRQRKGDWARHERVNFEEWVCPICHGVLSRREKLRDHLRDFHGSRDALQERHRRLTLCSSQRRCGFCQRRLESWSEWLAHVGAHFEGLLPGGQKTIAEWKDDPSPEPELEAGGMDIDIDIDADSITCMSELTRSTTTTSADSGFFSFSYRTPAASISITTSNDLSNDPSSNNLSNNDLSNNPYRSPRQDRQARPSSSGGRTAPPILPNNPHPDIYNAPAPTAGQPYAFPDPENQWSLQTMQSLLGCWTTQPSSS